eukprot:CAMPEP_0116124638 /NCGR_PEP_ID=MMETSP0329-20121206/5383_1 /TAXON_ID=697910 /ORGANISM="Pseudo-nitzschia arenysensis, Strain B593" /LENGTH=687 /DNA_ID=CAMNT_0003618623 /DNA_START=61 /DNA_END=2124 /DNA_ORIENTATION=+
MVRNSVLLGQSPDGDDDRNILRESGRKFNVDLLPKDLRRVYGRLEKMFDEDYALTVVFTIRTAVELHRAWHISLLTSNVLQQIKDKFKLRMTWTLGVIDLTFRMEDGLYELHRRVPYDYDSEYQNMYYKTAVALVEGDISVHDALIFQKELKEGKHSSPGGLIYRDNPGRLILYPFQAATCCMIFFSGDLLDAGVSAVCGLVAGLIEWALSSKKLVRSVKESKIMIDCIIGLSTGVITGLFYNLFLNSAQETVCLRSVFLGTLYWFFYGTAFVIGLLEIIASDLQTGVTRFLAVAVKTFVLSLASAAGLTIVLKGEVYDIWTEQLQPDSTVCDQLGLGGNYPWDPWWRILLYILCSISVLGQYRFILLNIWAGLIVQVAAYVAQEYIKVHLAESHEYDGMNRVYGDVGGAMASVVTAFIISYAVDYVRLQSRAGVSSEASKHSKSIYWMYKGLTGMADCIGIGRGLTRRTAEAREALNKQAKESDKPESEIVLSPEHESTLIEDAVEAQEYNLWSLLMPAVYQLVPGSQLALYWYNIIFPPQPYEDPVSAFFNETEDLTEIFEGATRPPRPDVVADSAAYALWITSISLALGLLMGLAIVRLVFSFGGTILSVCRKKRIFSLEDSSQGSFKRRRLGRVGITHDDEYNDPDDGIDLSVITQANGEGLRNRKHQTPDTINSPNSTEWDV